MKLTPDDERCVRRLLDLVAEHVTRLEDDVRSAIRQGRFASADRAYDRAHELRAALEAAVGVLGAFGVPTRALPLRPSEPSP